MTQRALVALAFVLSTAPAFALQRADSSAAPDLGRELDAWRAAHGSDWRLEPDAQTGHLQMLYGGHTESLIAPRDDAQFYDLARAALAQTYVMHGIDAGTLENVRTLHLPLGLIGSNDKMTVRFREVVDGVPVEAGFVNALFDMRGRLLSIQSTGLPHLAGFDVRPSVDARRATTRAVTAFRRKTQREETSISTPELVVDQDFDGEQRVARLAWKIDVHAEETGVEPVGLEWFVDARTGESYKSRASVHFFDVSGSVTANASPGLAADSASNPATQQPMAYMKVTSGATTTFTDASGNFTLPGLTAPVSATVDFSGTFSNVNHSTGTDYTLTTTLANPTGNVIQMAPVASEATTAQANAYRCSLLVRDFIKATNPSDTMGDFVVVSNVMVASNCNANWSGSATNFYSAGGGCSNFAFSTIVAHELGHWLNSRYGTGNGSDGMGEGNADVWALYTFDTPLNGQGAFNGSGVVRTGLNSRQFCGDSNSACYGEVHDDGEPWMGAAWKVRNRLNTLYGNAPGDAISNSIFLGWMNGYNQTQIKAIIETQWLTLDDDDGNINNGTPHYSPIDLGFKDQGFPGVVLQQVTVDTVTVLPDTTNQVTNYTVSARIVANQNPPLTATQIKYRLNGGSFQTVNMSHGAGDTYTGQIPAQLAVTKVEYYVTATNSAASTSVAPQSAPAVPLDFDVGIPHVLASFPFDFAADDQGWTHGSYTGTDEWQRGDPAGKTGTGWADPGSAFTPVNCWAMDLGNGTGGSYSANSNTWLRSPVINCSGAVGTHLRFKRWLSVQGSASDKAKILVNNTQVYINPTTNMNDGGWQAIDMDISALADGNPTVQVEWNLQANGTTNYGGWNIDDVEFTWIEDIPPPCAQPTTYCLAGANSAGPGAHMSPQGSGNISANDLLLQCLGCPAGSPGLFFYGNVALQAPFGNGFLCVGGSTFRLPIVTTNFFGDAVFALDQNALPHTILAGEQWYFQFWFRDAAAGGAGFNLSDGASVIFCP